MLDLQGGWCYNSPSESGGITLSKMQPDPLPRPVPWESQREIAYRPGKHFLAYLSERAVEWDVSVHIVAKRLAMLASTRLTVMHYDLIDELAGLVPQGPYQRFQEAAAHVRNELDKNAQVGVDMMRARGVTGPIATVDGVALLPVDIERDMIAAIIRATREDQAAPARRG